MQVIAAAVIKGGTGKTTTIAALAQAATAAGKKVLAIDLDPQANLSFTLGADQTRPGALQFLHGADPAKVIQRTEQNIFVISAEPDLATERTGPGTAKRLQDALEPLRKRFDYIFIDTPPTMGDMTYNALQAATGLIIPLTADNYSLQGLYQICDIAHQIQRSNPDLSIIGTVITKYDNRPKINRYMKEVIAGAEEDAPMLLAIRPGVAIQEAQALQKSLFEYAPRSKPAQDYMALYERLSKPRRKTK